MSQKKLVFRMIRDESGVSAVFGALLLLAIFTVFLSAFLATAVPAKIMQDESEKNDLLLSGIFDLSEKAASSGRQSFQTQYSVIQADENSGGIIFAADLSMTPETASFLKSDADFDLAAIFGRGFDSLFDEDDEENDNGFGAGSNFSAYRLSSGSLLFSCRYSQIPDAVYSFGSSSVLLVQEDGSSFLKPPEISVRENNGQFLISLSGDLIRSSSSSVFGNLTVLNYKVVQTAEVHDFASFVCIQYVPPESESLLNDFERNEIENSFIHHFAQIDEEINRNFTELRSEFDSKTRTLTISSDSPFEIDIFVREIEYSFS